MYCTIDVVFVVVVVVDQTVQILAKEVSDDDSVRCTERCFIFSPPHFVFEFRSFVHLSGLSAGS